MFINGNFDLESDTNDRYKEKRFCNILKVPIGPRNLQNRQVVKSHHAIEGSGVLLYIKTKIRLSNLDFNCFMPSAFSSL